MLYYSNAMKMLVFVLFALFIVLPLAAQDTGFTEAIKLDPDNAESWNSWGEEYLDKGEYDLALEAFSRAIALDPDFSYALYNRGRAYYYKGEYDRAIEDYNKAISLDLNFARAWNGRGVAYYYKGEYDRAIEDYSKAIALDPDFSYALYNRGRAYYSKGDYDRAIEDYGRAIALDPNNADAWNNRGHAYYYKGELDRAIEDYGRAIALDPKNADVRNRLGDEYLDMGEYNLAIEAFNKAITLDPNNADVWNNRGDAYYYRGELERAIEDYGMAITLDPNSEDTWNSLGKEFLAGGRYDLAIEAFNKAIALDPKDPNLWYNRGVAYSRKGESDRAIEAFNKAIALDPNDPYPWYNRGVAYSRKGESDRAIEDYGRAIALDPNDPYLWYNRGVAYANKGDYDRAIEDYGRAIALDPNDPSAWNSRGNAYRAKGELYLAIEDYIRAMALMPWNDTPNFWNYRGEEYFNNEEYNLAIEAFSIAVGLNPNYTSAWNNRGNAHANKGELDRAIEDYNRAITLNPNNSSAWNGRGNAYFAKGELDRAIEDYNKAIALDPNNVSAWNNRGNAYRAKGELDKAIEDFNKAIALNPNYVTAWNNRGVAYAIKRDYDQAIEDWNRALALNPNDYVPLVNRGTAYVAKGEPERAIEDYSRAINLEPYNSLAWYNRGKVYIDKDELNLAFFDFRQSIEAADRSYKIQDIFFRTWEFAGHFYGNYPYLYERKTGDELAMLYADTARESLGRSIARAENIRSTLGSRGAEIMTSLVYQYYAGVDLEARFGSSGEAYNYSEGLRSRGFLEQMGTEAALKLPGITPAEAQRIRDLINDINNLQNLLSALDPQMEADNYAEAGIALTRAESELASLDARISAKVPRYGELRNPKPASISQAQEWCGETRVVLEYVLWDSSVDFNAPVPAYETSVYKDRPSINSYCLVITKDGITPVRLDPDFDYAGKVNGLRSKLFRDRNGTIFTQPEPTFEAERNELYSALIKPVLQYIPAGINELVIVPDGSLSQLPFDMLRENDRSDDLGKTYRISLSPSVSVSVLAAKTGAPQKLPLMAFGGAWYDKDKTAADRGQRAVRKDSDGALSWVDLPGTATEVRNLQALISSPYDIQVFMGSDVSEAHIKSLSSQGELLKYPILHFACHGHFDEDDAERSGIVLSEVSGLLNRDEDGYLTIPEIVLLEMNSRMVLLSACETGLGTLKRGDGMVGMARAFLVSSVENVGVSLWSISDEATVEFMTRLYGKVLNEGKAFKEAYYLVKNEFRMRDDQWNHPYYWAAFTMYE